MKEGRCWRRRRETEEVCTVLRRKTERKSMKVNERERESSARGLNGRGSVSTPDILSREAVHAIRIAATPVWRVDINVAARITNSINGRGKAVGAATIGLKLFSQREIFLSPSESNAERQCIACRSGEMSSLFFAGISILANSMIVRR